MPPVNLKGDGVIVVPFCCVRNPKREGLQETIFNKGRSSVAETIHSTFMRARPYIRATLLKINTFEYNSKYIQKNFYSTFHRPLRELRTPFGNIRKIDINLFKVKLKILRLFSTSPASLSPDREAKAKFLIDTNSSTSSSVNLNKSSIDP